MICLKHKSDYMKERHGFESPEYLCALDEEYWDGLSVCILQDGHAGDCSFASGSDVLITFKDNKDEL